MPLITGHITMAQTKESAAKELTCYMVQKYCNKILYVLKELVR